MRILAYTPNTCNYHSFPCLQVQESVITLKTSKKKGEGISFLITETLDTDTLSSSYLGVSFQKSTSHNKRISPED